MTSPVDRCRARGFTLLETMVTLVIVSLMIALLMQALGQVLGLRERVLHYQRGSRLVALQEQWFRDSVRGAVVDLPDALGRMWGTGERFELVTAELLASDGIGRVGWALVPGGGGTALVHTDVGGKRLVVIEGPLHDARFEYRALDGEWVREWDPEEGADELLPDFVRFTARGDRADIDWVVPLPARAGPASPYLRPDDPAIGF